MKILLLDQFSELGGAQRCLLDLLPALRSEGWEVHVAVPSNGPLVDRLRERNVPVHSLSLREYSLGRKTLLDGVRFFGDFGVLVSEIRALAKSVDPAVVYVNGPRLLPAVERASLRRPVIFHAHSHVSTRNGKVLVASALNRTKATIIAATKCVARQWNRPSHVVYGGVEGPGKGWLRSKSGAGPRVGLIGRFTPQKCQWEFVQAAADLAAEWPPVEFFLCGDALFGDPASRHYKEQVLAEAPPAVRYLGWRDDVYGVLANLDLLVAPSLSEGGIPRVILEAFAARVPVLASAVGDTGEIIIDGQNGFLLPSAEAPVIAQRVRELLPRRTCLEAVAERAHQLWQERFTIERYQGEICGVIGDVIGSRDSVERKRGSL